MFEIIILTLLLALVLNFVSFLLAYKLQTDKLTDITWSLTFIAIIILDLGRAKQLSGFSILLGVFVIIWALRLGTFLLYRVLKRGKDKRFDERRSSFLGFLRFWLGQAIAAWVLLIPTTLAISRNSSFKYLSLIGLIIWIIGISIEATSDIQKYIFTSNPNNKNKWIDRGLWHLSRHPNYFGEILVWIGVYIYCFVYLPLWLALIGLVSPITIFLLLVFVSGIPILEKNADKKWGYDSNYKKYKSKTNILLPIPKV